MRPATQIRGNAEEAISDLAAITPQRPEFGQIEANLKDIIRIANKIDARTGTSDPSTKK